MIIDFHTHIFPSYFRNGRARFFEEEPPFENLYRSPLSRLVGRRELLDEMDRAGVHKSVIFGFPWGNPEYFRRHNDYILESVHRYPDRFVGFCCFSPFSPSAPDEAERCLKAGLSGLGELAVYDTGLSHEKKGVWGEIMEISAGNHVPVLLHANEPVGHIYPGKAPMSLRELYDFLKAYPSNRIVLAHWGGGIFFYALMKREVRDVLRNVWFDTAASPYLYIPGIYRIAVEIIGSEKILFGSDYPLLNPGRYFEDMERAGLASSAVRQIKGDNAAYLFNLNTHLGA